MLPIALTLLVALPPLPSELASCDVWTAVDQYASEYCQDCFKMEPVEVGGKKAFRFRTADGGMGRNAEHSLVEWIVYPDTCRMVGLEILSGGGSPTMLASFVHGPKNTAADVGEQAQLKAWSGFVEFDPKDPADQLAVTNGSCGSGSAHGVASGGAWPLRRAQAPCI